MRKIIKAPSQLNFSRFALEAHSHAHSEAHQRLELQAANLVRGACFSPHAVHLEKKVEVFAAEGSQNLQGIKSAELQQICLGKAG